MCVQLRTNMKFFFENIRMLETLKNTVANVLPALPDYGVPMSVSVLLPDHAVAKITGTYLGLIKCDTSEDFDVCMHHITGTDQKNYTLFNEELLDKWRLVGTHTTIENEKDIETIPAGTIVWRLNSEDEKFVRGSCYINRKLRSVLLCKENLQEIPKT